MRAPILILALGFASSVFAADIVTNEIAAAAKVYQPGFGAASVAVGATKSYAAWRTKFSYQPFGEELAADGRPLPDTRTTLAANSVAKVFAAGDVFYIFANDSTGSFLRRVDNSGATLRIGNVNTFLYNGSRILIIGTRTEIYDTNLNLVVPDLSASVSAVSWTVAGSKFFGISATGHFVSIDNDGHVQTLPATIGPEISPTIASNGTELLNVWMLADRVRLYAQRYALDGTTLSDVFDAGSLAGNQIARFDVAAAGGDFIVAWSEGGGSDVPIYFRRIHGSSADAQVLVGDGYHDAGTTPVVAAGPAGVFATWLTASGDVSGARQPMIRRIDAFANAQPLILGLGEQRDLHVVSDGLVTMAGWVEDGRVRIGRIDANGVPLDGAGIVVAPDLPAVQALDSLLFDGVNYFVLLENVDYHPDGRLNHAYARLVHRDGTFATALFTLLPAQALLDEPTAAWTGTVYRVIGVGGDGNDPQAKTKVIFVDVRPSGVVIPPVATSAAVTGDVHSLLWGARPLYIDRQSGSATFLDDQSTIAVPVDPSANGGRYVELAATNATSLLIPWLASTPYPRTPQLVNYWLERWDMSGKPIGIPWLVASWSSPDPNALAPAGLFALADGATNYKLVIDAGTGTARLACLDEHAFTCRCIDNATDLPGVSGVTDFAAAGTDRTVVAYVRTVTETGMTPAKRAFIRFVHPGPPPRRRAAGK